MNTTLLNRNRTVVTFNPEDIQGLDKKILDELSDGQWHPEYKIKRVLGEPAVIGSLSHLSDKNFLISGENSSFRMNSTILSSWRSYTDFPQKDIPRYQPRYFGGILEDDGWEIAGLKNYDLIHFRVSGDISKKTIENIIDHKGQVTRSENGLHRVFSQNHGEEIYAAIKAHKFDTLFTSFSGVRLEKGVKRRDINDLPHRFTGELCQFYGSFAKVLLRPHMSSITKHIAEYDDVQQQIYLWVIDAVQRYDHTTSIPFAAFLSKMLSKWVFNLGRQSFGRSVADIEIKHSRVSNLLRNELEREPTMEEVATALGEPIEQVREQRSTIKSVANMRSVETIDNDESVIQIAASETTTGKLDEYVSQNVISECLVEAMLAPLEVSEDGLWNTHTPNFAGFLHVYHETWGSARNKKLLPPASGKMVDCKEKALNSMRKFIEDKDVL